MFDSAKNWINGKTTYIAGVATILTTVLAWAHGDCNIMHAVMVICGAITAMRLRVGVQKAQDAAGAAAPVITVHPGGTVNVTSGGVGSGSTDVNADQH